MKKVIRSWDVPTQDYPSAISEDGKTLFLRVGFTEKDRERGIKVTSTIGKKMKQEFPYSLLAISANEIKFVEAKPILTQQTSERNFA